MVTRDGLKIILHFFYSVRITKNGLSKVIASSVATATSHGFF